VNRFPNRCLARIAVIGALVATLGVAGCGRKGGLDPPPAAAVADQAPATGGSGPGIGPDGRPVAPPGQKKSFFLDWLIN